MNQNNSGWTPIKHTGGPSPSGGSIFQGTSNSSTTGQQSQTLSGGLTGLPKPYAVFNAQGANSNANNGASSSSSGQMFSSGQKM